MKSDTDNVVSDVLHAIIEKDDMPHSHKSAREIHAYKSMSR